MNILDTRERLTFEAVFQMNMIRSRKKPERCPECRSWLIAEILYGEPAYNMRLGQKQRAKKEGDIAWFGML